jgi:hypothetical protein
VLNLVLNLAILPTAGAHKMIKPVDADDLLLVHLHHGLVLHQLPDLTDPELLIILE